MSDPLDHASAVLLARLVKEEGRVAEGGPTRELGGVARVSAQLEGLLRVLLNDMAHAQGTSADVLLNEGSTRPVALEKATAGHLLKPLYKLSKTAAAGRPSVRLLMDEVARRTNRIRAVVDARNDVVHGNSEPDSARQAIAALRVLIEDYRRAAGWTNAGAAPPARRRMQMVQAPPRGRRPS